MAAAAATGTFLFCGGFGDRGGDVGIVVVMVDDRSRILQREPLISTIRLLTVGVLVFVLD